MLGRRAFGVVATLAVIGAVVAGVAVLDTPAVQRAQKLDGRRVDDLIALRDAIGVYWSRHDALPRDLGSLGAEPGLQLPAGDPETGAPYEYQVTGDDSYEICAAFTTDTATTGASWGRSGGAAEWSHGAGRQCFPHRVKKRTRAHA